MAGLLAWAADVVGAGGRSCVSGSKFGYFLSGNVALIRIVPVCTCVHAQLREVTLQEENAAYEKVEEAELLRRKLEEMEDTEKNLRDVLEDAQTALDASRSCGSDESVGESQTTVETGDDIES